MGLSGLSIPSLARQKLQGFPVHEELIGKPALSQGPIVKRYLSTETHSPAPLQITNPAPADWKTCYTARERLRRRRKHQLNTGFLCPEDKNRPCYETVKNTQKSVWKMKTRTILYAAMKQHKHITRLLKGKSSVCGLKSKPSGHPRTRALTKNLKINKQAC